jgi:transcriptional regulator of acetoin/glycerol metabolism
MPIPKHPSPRVLSALLASRDARTILRIRAVLERHRGGVKAAAAELKVGRATLHRWMRTAGIEGRGTPGPAPREKKNDVA